MSHHLLRWLSAFAALCMPAALRADTFFPITSVTSSTSSTDFFPVSRLIEGAGVGFDVNPPHNRTSSLTWVTNAPNGGTGDYFNPLGTFPILVFDLGQDRALTEISVWGYADTNANGGKDFSLRFASAADGPAGFGTSVTYSPAFTLTKPTSPRQSKSFGQVVVARYVEMTLTDNFFGIEPPGGDRVGLGEVAFQDRNIAVAPTVDMANSASFYLNSGTSENFALPVGNAGQNALVVTAATFTGPQASAFSLVSLPPSVAFLTTQDLVFRVNPTGQPAKMEATVRIVSNDPASPKLVNVTVQQPSQFYPIDSITSATEGFDYFSAQNLIQGIGVGFDSNAPHPQLSGDGTVMLWVTNDANGGTGDYFSPLPTPSPLFVFDLGQDVLLGEISFWGYSSGNANGMREFSARFGTSAGGVEGIGSSVAFTTTGAVPFGASARYSHSLGRLVRARYVEITPVDNYYGSGLAPGGDRVGLGEVAFEVVPSVDPQAFVPPTIAITSKGEPVTGSFQISNAGSTKTLTVTSVVPSGANASLATVSSFPTTVAPGAAGSVAYTFGPGTLSGAFDTYLTVTTNDPLTPVTTVRFTGTVQNPAIDLASSVSFGPLEPTAGTQTLSIPVKNLGFSNQLTLSNLTLTGPQAANFSLGAVSSPLAAQGTGSIPLVFDRQGKDGVFRVNLSGSSNDPLRPQFIVTVVVQVKITNPLVAWWPLDVDGSDASGNGHDGAPVGNPVTIAGANAATLGGMSFDGSTRFDVPYDAALNPQSFTVTLWANPNFVGGGYQSAITSRDDVSAGVQTHGYILYIEPDGRWFFWTGDGDPGWSTLAGASALAGEWTHVALSYDALTNTKKLYLDGTLVSSVAGTTQLYSPNGTTEQEPLHIGAGQDDGLNFWFNGGLDDIGLFRDVLTAEQIQTIRTSGVAGFVSPVAPFKILTITVPTPGSIRIGFESTAGTTYQIQRSTTLVKDEWTTLTAVTGAAGSTLYTDSNLPAGAKQIFYRVKRLD